MRRKEILMIICNGTYGNNELLNGLYENINDHLL